MQKCIEETMKYFLQLSSNYLSKEGYNGIKHYYDHGEYEMAFEGLALELIMEKKHPVPFEFEKWVEFAKCCRLDKESVFEFDFWNHFLRWGKSYKKES